ncbi:MAG TPA: UxaA family hydrolase, partial [Gaiellales bacterium]|nr:UxaA family hydrolase [Gaiellales bacterium]
MAALPLTVRLNPNDNVVVARVDILPGTELPGEGLGIAQRIPAGHKVATRPIAVGQPIRKFDQIIGFATTDIAPGEHIHVHNCGMREFARDYAVGQDVRPTPMVPEAERPSFGGFVRGNGKVGTRNYIGILSTVNCSASVSKFIADRFPAEVLAQYPNVDGIVAITHGTGCGMADRGEGYATLQRTLWGFAAHPNFASILMIGLGC